MRTYKRLWSLALVAGLALLAGCNLISVEPASTPTPVTPPTATTVPVSDPGAPFVTFQVSGGIAGMQRAVAVQAGGAATLTERAQLVGTAQLPAARLAEIRAKLDAAQFFTLQDRYDQGGVADDIYYTITATQDGQTKSVTVAEVGGKTGTPQPLIDLITNLRELEGTVRADLTPAPAAPAPPGPSEATATPAAPAPAPSDTPVPAPAATDTPAASAPAATDTPVAGTPVPAAATATAEGATINEGADLIIYRVRGGIAGLDTAMYIGRRGTVTFQSRGQETGRAQLTASQVGELIDLFDTSGFFSFQDRYAPVAAPADSQEMSVTYNHGGQVKTVTVATEGQPPAALQTILDRLAALQAELQKK